ncbi:MAG: UbiA family prenyltransferase [Verrucomicrobia bacterium]|nr:UbiA family prenyltransferase [Verrucomicrobiota bacterium]
MRDQRRELGQRIGVWLTLARVTNLPTVWSNCLAAILIGGGTDFVSLLGTIIGGSFVYAGGVMLNDYFDRDFDARFRPARAIPSGRISPTSVFLGGVAALAAGVLVLDMLAHASLWLSLTLVVLVFTYDLVHKATALAPVLMAACRLNLYLVAASASFHGVTGLVVWCGLALACYVAGLSCVSRQEVSRAPLAWWPILLMVVPMALALVANAGPYRETAIALSLLLAIWLWASLKDVFNDSGAQYGPAVSRLLAGIVLVDLLNVVAEPARVSLVFVALFGLTLLGQRYSPGT